MNRSHVSARARRPAPPTRDTATTAPRSPAAQPQAPVQFVTGLEQLQRTIGNRGAARVLGLPPVQRKLAYESDWVAWMGTTWATGAKEIWTKLQPAFDDRFMPALNELQGLLDSAWMSDEHRARINELKDTWGKYDTQKIPLATGQTLNGKIEALITEAGTLKRAVISGIAARATAIETSMTDVTAPFLAKYSNWPQMDIKDLKGANDKRKTLLAEFAKAKSGSIVNVDAMTKLESRAQEVISVFTGAESDAAKKAAKLTEDKQAKEAAAALEANKPKPKAEMPKDPLVDRLRNPSLVGGLRAFGHADDVILKLLDLGITAGRLQEVLRHAIPEKIEPLLKLASDDASLVKLLKAIGGSGHEDELIALLTAAPKQDAALEALLTKVNAGSLAPVKEILELFPADKDRAANAAKVFGATTRGEEANLLTVLRRVGQAQSVQVAEALAHTTPSKLDFMTDPTRAAHAFAFVHTELVAGHKIWGGETAAEPAYELANGTAVTLAHVRANATNYQAHGYPAPNTGRFSSDRFNNRGGDDMKLPTNTTYTEYDIREFTAPADRGLKRVVIGANGSKYYTPDHYATFTKF